MSNLPERPPYEVAHISQIPCTELDDGAITAAYGFTIGGDWKQIRHYFGIEEFSVNAFVATEAGQELSHEHYESANDDESRAGAEEIYYIAAGRAKVELNATEQDAPEGTLIFIGDPSVVRRVVALSEGTVLLAMGTRPGVKFVPSRFEESVSPAPRWSRPGAGTER